jgi:hypothetical protein
VPKKIAVVDGANVAYIEKSKAGAAKVSNILAVRSALVDKGYETLIIVDASLVYEIDDRPQLEALIDDQVIRQVPAETDADFFILVTAKELEAIVISNDEYEPYQQDYPWIKERRVPAMIIDGKAELYEPKLEQIREQK